MKKVLLGFLCLIVVIMSCEIPQSVTIKGNPGFYVPLGSPFSSVDSKDRLENFLTIEKIKEMMDSDNTGETSARVFEYTGPDVDKDLKAFLVHYPLAEMKLHFSEHINEAMESGSESSYEIPEFPNFPSNNFPNTGLYLVNGDNPLESHDDDNSLFVVPLTEMAKLVQVIKGGENRFGLEIDYDEDFEEYLRVYIPAFEVGSPDNYKKGKQEETSEGNKLRFLNDDDDLEFVPRNFDDGLRIYVQIMDSCAGKTITPKVVFEWEEATIDTSGVDDFKGSYIIENVLGNFLGGVEFKEAKGYIYMNGIKEDSTAKITLGVEYEEPLVNEKKLVNKERPDFLGKKNSGAEYSEAIPAHSLVDGEFIDFKGILNREETSMLEYKITIGSMEISYNDEILGTTISADMIILLPMEFKVENDSDYDSDYVKLDLGDVLPEPGEDGKDIFMREGNDDDLLNNLESVEIFLTKVDNNIFDLDNLALRIVNSESEWDPHYLRFGDKQPSLTIEFKDLPNPFIPKFEIVLKKDTGKDYAMLTLLRTPDPKFDIFLAIKAKASIDYTITF